AAEYYLARENLFIVDERQKVRLAIDRLGLSSLHEFNPNEKIIEYMIDDRSDGPLIGKTVREFVEAVGARTPAPGGGSAAALIAALGVALGSMVGWLTYGRRKFEHLEAHVRANLPTLVELQDQLLRAIDRDTEAYNDYMVALGMPKGSDQEIATRRAAMQEGLKNATRVPLEAMELIDKAWTPMLELARIGQFSSRSDLEVGAKALEAGLYGAHRNVLINLEGVKDAAFKQELEQRAVALMERGRARFAEIQAVVGARTGDVQPGTKTT
ncbi:MAG TPA: cyclodeaminase/cyclohydrolase family protein, partial [Longimicrobiales bacterium]|nr:cyclodeaminase/cyclohydrolase family protein [Longimicrobiales bacterium]